jgi:hypothetical protein
MEKELHITATIDQPSFLEDMVEQLAYRRHEFGYWKQKMPFNHEALETSSVESYVNGWMVMDDSVRHIKVPFTTRFLFTCIKEKVSGYQLGWSYSLS